MYRGEPRSGEVLEKIKAAPVLGVGAPTLVETAMVLAVRLGGNPMPLLADLLRELQVEVVPFGAEHAPVACQAYLRFGKRRHRANLNFGDCLAYAAAAVAREPLLFVGNGLTQTDLPCA